MPPQPPGSTTIYSGDANIPGATVVETSDGNLLSQNSFLRTHSAKFPIERELILTNEKGSSKIPLMTDRSGGLLLNRQMGSAVVAPDHPPKHLQAWNTQSQQQLQAHNHHQDSTQPNLTGAIPRTPARLPEDVTALAERENNKDRELKDSKNAVTKTYHTIKDLISSRFKKDANENIDGLNNVIVQNSQQSSAEQDELRSPYSALPPHMRQHHHGLNTTQSANLWNSAKTNLPQQTANQQNVNQQQAQQQFTSHDIGLRGVQQRATSQPQLNVGFDRRNSQGLENVERRGSLANIDITDSDDGGFVTHHKRSQNQPNQNTLYLSQQQQQHQQQHQHQTQISQQMQQQCNQQNPPNETPRNSPHHFRNTPNAFSTPSTYTQFHMHQQQQQQQIQQQPQNYQQYQSPYIHTPSPQQIQNHNAQVQQQLLNMQSMQIRQDLLRVSFHKAQQQQLQQNQQNGVQHHQELNQNLQDLQQINSNETNNMQASGSQPQGPPKLMPKPDGKSKLPSSAASSDYDKSGNHSSNVDSGRGSAAYSSGRKAVDTSPENSDSVVRPSKENDSEWVDIVDAELRNILEPGMQNLNIRPESTVSGSVSSITPPLPPVSPDGVPNSRTKSKPSTDSNKLEYGMDSYNRPGRSAAAIGPCRAGWPSSSIHKQNISRIGKKQEQSLLKRHLFGLDNDQTSTTTRSLDLESLLGGPWCAGQSVSDSETDTQGLRHIRSQLEGLEHMYSEVLKMLGSRNAPAASRINETPLRSARRRHGSLSSLPSSSVSSRPIRDRRRNEDRRKVRDIKGINKRFQRLESHVVTLARSVAHLSSEMRSEHLELERMRDDITTLRNQAHRSQIIFGTQNTEPEPPNLTNPKRVKKLTKFFGEDPPLMRLFLKRLGYEKYAELFESERVGMIELPYLGEERLQKLGVPLGPRLRILQEAQISLCKDTTLCIV
ncbi:uncharacterized protein LOC129614197 isoform X2 [Condylostylus longicornis]|nr:uncharacterized protein LOC129614197 isoform X2 [Condylostylus longicornis]